MVTLEKKKRFAYKRASFLLPVVPDTLQTLVARALEKFKIAKDRHANPASDGVAFELINYYGNHGRHTEGGKLLGCELFSYNKGGNLGAIKFTADGQHLDVDSICPANANEEFLEGTVYFGILDDHVIVMQSTALKCADLERHLNWLLKDKAGVLDEANQLELADNEPPVDGSYRDVVGLKFSSPMKYEVDAGKAWKVNNEKAKRKRWAKKGKEGVAEEDQTATIHPIGRSWEALKAFVGEQFNLPDKLSAEELLRTGKMNVTLLLNWSGSSKNDAADFVSDIAHRLRNVEDDELDYAVNTRSGEIKKDQFKPKKTFTIKWGRVRPDFNSLFPNMLAWLQELEETKKITL